MDQNDDPNDEAGSQDRLTSPEIPSRKSEGPSAGHCDHGIPKKDCLFCGDQPAVPPVESRTQEGEG